MNTNNHDAEFTLKPSDFLTSEQIRLLIGKALVLERLTAKKLNQAVTEWLQEKRIEQLSPRTLGFYRYNIQPFLDFTDQESEVHTITHQQVNQYLAISQQRRGPYAHRARYKALENFFNFCLREQYIMESPVRGSRPKVPKRIKPMFSDGELRAMLENCKGTGILRDRAILLTFIDTGMRLRELANLELADFNMPAHRCKVMGKGAKERELQLSLATVKAISKYLRFRGSVDDRLWLSEEGKPLTASGIQQIIRRISKRALGKVSGPHKFRHTFASNFLLSGGQEFDLQRLLGHSSLKIVQEYVQATQDIRALKAHQKYSPVDHLGLK